MVRRTGMPRFVAAAVCGLSLLSACAPAALPTAVPGAPDGPSPTAAAPPLPVGAPPRVPYVAGRWYVAPDRRLRLPGGRRGVTGAVVYDDGLLVADARIFEGTVGLARVRNGRWVASLGCSSGVPATSADRRYVAWATTLCLESGDTTAGAIHRSRASGGGEVVVPVAAGLVSVVGFLGHDVVYQLGFAGGVWVSDLAGTPRRIPGIDHARDTSTRRSLVLGGRGDRTDRVLRPDGTPLWRVAEGDLIGFSPAGGRVVAFRDDRLVVLRSRDGSTAVTIDLAAEVEAWSVTWESERTLLALEYDAGRVAVVRLHLDGRAERATAWRAVDASGGPYVLLP